MPGTWIQCVDRAVDLLFPPKCSCCGERLDVFRIGRNDTFCEKCLGFFNSETFDRCPDCASFLRDCRCVTPMMKRAGCRELIKIFRYRPERHDLPTDRLVLRLKENATRRALAYPAEILAAQIDSFLTENEVSYADVVLTWVPRRDGSVTRYGYDQSEKLARSVAVEVRRKTADGECLQVMKTVRRNRFSAGNAQKTLGRREREKNARNSFALRNNVENDLSGKTVLLLDDVVTTGASMAACARLLRSAGAGQVVGVCLGMTFERKEKT